MTMAAGVVNLHPAMVKGLGITLVMILMSACGGPRLREDIQRLPSSRAAAPASAGLLAELASGVANRHGPEHSVFKLLDGSFDGLYWRLAVIDSATVSVDILTYLWYPGRLGPPDSGTGDPGRQPRRPRAAAGR